MEYCSRLLPAIVCLLILIGCSNQSVESSEKEETGLELKTGLPVLYISLPGEVSDKDHWKNAQISMDSLDTEGVIKGHGNTTWTLFPKKAYSIKMDGKKWVLLANYRDRTLMRNEVAFEISRKVGLPWTPTCLYVEFVMNDSHKGNYLMCEAVTLDNLQKNTEGAVLLEFDRYLDADNSFLSSVKNLPVSVKEPKKISATALKSLQAQLDSIECSLYQSCDYKVEDFLDLETFAKYLIVYELNGNSEIRMPKSAFIHRLAGEKWQAGPVWDFDWNSFMLPEKDILVKQDGLRNMDALWYDALLKNETFKKILKDQWDKSKGKLDDIRSYITTLSKKIRVSDSLNSILWPIDVGLLGDDLEGDEEMDFEQAVKTMQKTLEFNYSRLDSLVR